MLDDDNAKEMEAALREEEEQDIPDGMTPEEWHTIQEEAQAEEEFIADREDKVKPLVFQKKTEDGSFKKIDMRPEAHSVDASDGVLGSGDLEVDRAEKPINNEVELIKEKVKDMDPKTNPDVAADPVADTPVDDSNIGGDTTAEPTATDSPVDAAPAGEPVAEPESATEPAPAAEAPADIIDNSGVEQAPSADVPAATETPTPIPGGMPTSPVSADAAAAAPVAEPKKKKKTGLIIGIVVFLLLIIGGGVGFFIFYQNHEAPEQQVKDAVSNVLNAKTVGATRVSALESGQLPYVGMSINSESTQYGKMSFSFDFALKGVDTFYLKVDGISGVVKSAVSGLTTGSDASSNEALGKIIDAVIKPIDGSWIALDIDDEEAKQTLSCINDSVNSLSSESFRKKVDEAFNKYPFIKFKKDSKVENRNGINYYEVEIDEDLEEKFNKELEDLEEMKALEKCTGSFNLGGSSTTKTSIRKTTSVRDPEDDDDDWDDDDDGYVYWDDDDEDISTGPLTTIGADEERTNTIKFGISSWSHELQAVEIISETKDGKKDTININFKSISENDVKDAKTAEKLVDEIKTAALDGISEYYCEEMKNQYGDYFESYFGTQQKCIDMVKEQYKSYIDQVDLGDLMGGLGGGAVRTKA